MDRHVTRSGDDYAEAMQALLPIGQAWPRHQDSILMKVVRGLTRIWGDFEKRASTLLEVESDPRITFELLTDWERNWGLPDECFPQATSIADRQALLMLKMTWMGAQSREYFEYIMQEWFDVDIHIKEFAPFMAGVSHVGDTRPEPDENFRWYIGPPEMRFCWSIQVGSVTLSWFRSASGQAGVDPHLRIGVPQEVQCLLNRWKPAHTELVLDFGEMAFGDPMQGTP